MNEIVTMDGEVLEPGTSMAVQLQKGEIDQMISTAKAYPRSLQKVQRSILSMATLDEESAEECMYALPRGGKPIKGPSIRFAEILKQSYGNCRAAARVVHIDKAEGYVEAEGMFHDLETNSASTARVRRRILDKNGRVFKDDMIIVTGNAACSIAMRNAILNGVPKPLWRKAYDTVQATIAGDVTTLAVNREKAIKAMAAFGVKPERVFEALGIAGEEEIGVDHIVTLRGMYSALKNGEATVEEMFAGTMPGKSDHQKVADPLADDPQPAKTETRPAPSSSEPDTEQAAGASPDRQEVMGDNSPASEPSTDDVGETDGIDPDAPASEHEDAMAGRVSEADGAGAIGPAELDGVGRFRLCEAAQKLLEITTAADLDPKGMQEAVTMALPGWKDHVGAEQHERLRKVVKRVNDVIAGKSKLAAAVALIAAELDAKPADIEPAKGGRRG